MSEGRGGANEKIPIITSMRKCGTERERKKLKEPWEERWKYLRLRRP